MIKSTTPVLNPASKVIYYKAQEVFGTYFVHATGGSNFFNRAAKAKLIEKELDKIAKKLDLKYLICKVGDSKNPKQRTNAYYGNVTINETLVQKAGKAMEVMAFKPFYGTKFMRPKGTVETYVAWFKYENYLEAKKLLDTLNTEFPKFDFLKESDVEKAVAILKKFGDLAEPLSAIEGAQEDVATLYKKDVDLDEKDAEL
ncbi:hypothetical protein M413DRAFT_7649 [Hebeloma cylindrosporum]|uniref:Uncharacterized protein n=1 Tax=Hebeloma cylindrosporum TaxID=76867 RepID=A0A0C3CDX1_HEBCY|nr:hypothetical protein M413DRAFT_7649 [Hebeloma cylindrosporum h7]